MLDPSSSEEESGDEVLEEDRRDALLAVSQRSLPAPGRDSRNERRSGTARPASPSPSIISEKEKEDQDRLQREEDERRTRLQIYVFVLRCIAYPFNAKQPTDMSRRQQKVCRRTV
ncbi:CAPS1 protein, partial [Polyodon spathula]|nr:CAPS1 protein [Polyodon spathula]